MQILQDEDRTVVVSAASTGAVETKHTVSEIVTKQNATQVVTTPTKVDVTERGPTEVVESARIILIQHDAPAAVVHVHLNSTTLSEVDSLPAGQASSFTWRVQIDAIDLSQRISFFVACTHNGVNLDPTDVQWTVFGKIKFGDFSSLVEVKLEEVAGVMRVKLLVAAVTNSQVTAWRMHELG